MALTLSHCGLDMTSYVEEMTLSVYSRSSHSGITVKLIYNKTGKMRINVTSRRVRVTIFCSEKQIHIEGVFVAYVIQHTTRNHPIIL